MQADHSAFLLVSSMAHFLLKYNLPSSLLKRAQGISRTQPRLEQLFNVLTGEGTATAQAVWSSPSLSTRTRRRTTGRARNWPAPRRLFTGGTRPPGSRQTAQPSAPRGSPSAERPDPPPPQRDTGQAGEGTARPTTRNPSRTTAPRRTPLAVLHATGGVGDETRVRRS